MITSSDIEGYYLINNSTGTLEDIEGITVYEINQLLEYRVYKNLPPIYTELIFETLGEYQMLFTYYRYHGSIEGIIKEFSFIYKTGGKGRVYGAMKGNIRIDPSLPIHLHNYKVYEEFYRHYIKVKPKLEYEDIVLYNFTRDVGKDFVDRYDRLTESIFKTFYWYLGTEYGDKLREEYNREYLRITRGLDTNGYSLEDSLKASMGRVEDGLYLCRLADNQNKRIRIG